MEFAVFFKTPRHLYTAPAAMRRVALANPSRERAGAYRRLMARVDAGCPRTS